MGREYSRSEFSGESRELLVEGLLKLYEDLISKPSTGSTYQPKWVSLEAPPGWGKTRIGLELYERLAARQEEPTYWPLEIDPALERKATYPVNPVHNKNSLPQYLWMGFACSLYQGTPTQAWRADIQQLGDHLVLVDHAYKAVASAGAKWGPSLKNVLKQLRKQGVAEASSLLLSTLGWLFPGSGAVPQMLEGGYRTIQEKLEIRRLIREEFVFNTTGTSDQLDDVVDFLVKISTEGFRVVILVEDIHRADEMLFEFVGKLMRSGGSILIISTATPEELRKVETLDSMFDEHADSVLRVKYKELAPLPFAKTAGMDDLEDDALRKILHGFFPNVDDHTSAMLLDRYVSPLALELFCRADEFHERFPDGDLTLDPEEVAVLPVELSDLYAKLWYEIPLEVRVALAIAWLITPENINIDEADGERSWSASTLHEVIQNLDFVGLDRDALIEMLDNSQEPHAWVRIIDDYLRAFLEPQHGQIVQKVGLDVLDQKLAGKARHKILAALATRLLEQGADDPTLVNRARTILALHREGFIEDPQVVAEATDALLDHFDSNRRELPERDRLSDLYGGLTNREQVSSKTDFSLRRKAAATLAEGSRPVEAIDKYKALIDEMSKSEDYGPTNTATLEVRRELARCEESAYRYDDSIATLEALVRDMNQVYSHNDPVTLTTQLELSFLRMDINGYVAVLNELIAETDGVDPYSLSARRGYMFLLSNLGRHDEAIQVCNVLVRDTQEVLGAYDPSAFDARRHLALQFEFSDQFEKAISVNRELLKDMESALGPNHPSVLEVRCELVYKLYQDDQPVEALKVCAGLIARATRVLGRAHQTTRLIETTRISALIAAGDTATAVEASTELLSYALSLPGSDDVLGQEAKNWHAHILYDAGRMDLAVPAFKEMLEHDIRIMGREHPGIYRLRMNLIDWLHEANTLPEALMESKRLVEDAKQRFDFDHEIYREAVSQLQRLQELDS